MENEDMQVYVRNNNSKPKKRGCIAVSPVSNIKKPAPVNNPISNITKIKKENKINNIYKNTKEQTEALFTALKNKLSQAKKTIANLKKPNLNINLARLSIKPKLMVLAKFSHNFSKKPIVRATYVRASKYLKYSRYFKYRKPVAIVVASLCLVASLHFSGFSIGYDVYVNGKRIATVTSEKYYRDTINKLNKDISSVSGQTGDINPNASFMLAIVSKNGYTNPTQLTEKLKEYSKQLIDSFAIYVDGKAMVALKDEASANNILSKLKNKYISEKDVVSTEFVNNVEIKKQRSPIFIYMSEDSAYNKLAGTEQIDGIYEIAKKDTLWSIARANDMTVATLKAINPGLTDIIHDGKKINIKQPKPIIGIKTIEKASYEEAIPCDVKKIDDESSYTGKSNITNEGKDGLSKVEAEIVKVNGIETARNILSTTILAQPQDKVVMVGIKPIPKGIGTGTFSRPFFGTITSRFGPRWGSRHTGVDFSGNIGDPIHVSDDGKITYVGYDGGYGNLVIVNHNNGYETWYGHMSKFNVTVGDTVQKGDTIGFIGNTGFSTGPHLHFEVRKNGTPVDPLDYLK